MHGKLSTDVAAVLPLDTISIADASQTKSVHYYKIYLNYLNSGYRYLVTEEEVRDLWSRTGFRFISNNSDQCPNEIKSLIEMLVNSYLTNENEDDNSKTFVQHFYSPLQLT